MTAFTKPGIQLIEVAHVPVKMASAVGRIDVIGGNMIFTCYQWQPGPGGQDEAVVVEKLGFPTEIIPDEVQFVVAVLAQIGWQLVSKPLALN